MDKRLAKRHKRQVARAKEHAKVSEPDVRTHEQIEAARKASRPDLVRGANIGWLPEKPQPEGTEQADAPAESPQTEPPKTESPKAESPN